MRETERDRMLDYFHNPKTTAHICANCEHFCMHYTKWGWPFGLGHCVFPRLKNRKAYDTCEKYESKAVAE